MLRNAYAVNVLLFVISDTIYTFDSWYFFMSGGKVILLFLASRENFGVVCSPCSFSVILRWVNAIKVWANAIKIQDQNKKIRKHCFRKLIIWIIETKYEYFNALSKHFVRCNNPFFYLCWSGILIALAHTLIAISLF